MPRLPSTTIITATTTTTTTAAASITKTTTTTIIITVTINSDGYLLYHTTFENVLKGTRNPSLSKSTNISMYN